MKRLSWPRSGAIWLLLAACGGGGTSAVDGSTPPPVDGGGGDAVAVDASEPVLRVDFIDPDHGPYTGGTEVLVRGRGFAVDMSIAFGGRSVEPLDVNVVDERRVIVRTPPGDPGVADVTVTVGGLSATLPGAFTYEAITVDPPTGAVAGGTYVTIRGFGTAFQPGDLVTLGGVPLVDATVVAEQEITGYTPPGVAGSVDVVVAGTWGSLTAIDGFTYLDSSDPFEGGLGGGPIVGALNVSVVDSMTGNGVDAAYVVVGDPATSAYQGLTDDFGEIVFSAPDFAGPVSVTAAKEGYEATSIVIFDARDATIFLVPIPDPQPGPLPPGRQGGVINGYILFGSATGIGTTGWTLVPDPRTPTESLRAYVYTTSSSIFTPVAQPGAGGIVAYDEDLTAWPFSIGARPAALAVYAVAGLYDSAVDPDGPEGPLPPGVFQAFALGVTRGILVGPGETLDDIPIIIDTPLDTAVRVDLASPPPLFTPGWYGPTEYTVEAFIDLGGEGVIGLPGNSALYPPGSLSVLLESQAPLAGNIADGTYSVIAGAWSEGGFNPFSVRIVRGHDDLSSPLVVDDFLGTPRAVDPAPNGTATGRHLRFEAEAGTSGAPTFQVFILAGLDGTPIWRMIVRGDTFEVPIPDLEAVGLPPLPTDFIVWTIYEITVPGLSFDDWSYRHLSATYWSAYAADAFVVSIPPPP